MLFKSRLPVMLDRKYLLELLSNRNVMLYGVKFFKSGSLSLIKVI